MEITDEMIQAQAEAGFVRGGRSWKPEPCQFCDGTEFTWVKTRPGELTRMCAKCEPWSCSACKGTDYFYRIVEGKLRRICKPCEKDAT
jgi:hypothetical protein